MSGFDKKGSEFSSLILLALTFLLIIMGCGRKDVNRHGEIKLRGERPVSTENKKKGALLQKGIASWYGKKYHGRRTANGEVYDMWAMTAAHKSLPFGTRVKVENRDNDRWIVVRINDRGPFIKGRIIDLSRKAARELGIEATGTARVSLYLAEGDSKSGKVQKPDRDKIQKPDRDRSGAQPVDGYWTVQVGSFKERARAEAVARQVLGFTKDVKVVREGGMHRVRAGHFIFKADAGRLASLLNENNMDVWVVHVSQ